MGTCLIPIKRQCGNLRRFVRKSPQNSPLNKRTSRGNVALSIDRKERHADKEWQKVKAESEANGPLVDHIDRYFMDPTSFSDLQ
jgi:hypothetical protein